MTYTKDELSQRNGKILSEIWVAYKGKIYDVTQSDLFANGEHYEHLAGQDLTKEMDDAPHLDDVMDDFRVVGELVG